MILSKEQLGKLLNEIPAGYVKPTELPAINLPPFMKLGVLVDLDEIETEVLPEAKYNSKSNQATLKSYYCIECKRILPTAHLLDIHISETHDLYFAASVERGDKPMFSCYLEECQIKFQSPEQRKDHCITLHKFPPNYRFDQSKGISTKQANSMDVDESSTQKTNSKQLPYIKAFSFGHQTSRTFNSRNPKPEVGETLKDVQAMKDALSDIME